MPMNGCFPVRNIQRLPVPRPLFPPRCHGRDIRQRPCHRCGLLDKTGPGSQQRWCWAWPGSHIENIMAPQKKDRTCVCLWENHGKSGFAEGNVHTFKIEFGKQIQQNNEVPNVQRSRGPQTSENLPGTTAPHVPPGIDHQMSEILLVRVVEKVQVGVIGLSKTQNCTTDWGGADPKVLGFSLRGLPTKKCMYIFCVLKCRM